MPKRLTSRARRWPRTAWPAASCSCNSPKPIVLARWNCWNTRPSPTAGDGSSARWAGSGPETGRQTPGPARFRPARAGSRDRRKKPAPPRREPQPRCLESRVRITNSWRRGRDSNPRSGVTGLRFSRPVHSSALPPLRSRDGSARSIVPRSSRLQRARGSEPVRFVIEPGDLQHDVVVAVVVQDARSVQVCTGGDQEVRRRRRPVMAASRELALSGEGRVLVAAVDRQARELQQVGEDSSSCAALRADQPASRRNAQQTATCPCSMSSAISARRAPGSNGDASRAHAELSSSNVSSGSIQPKPLHAIGVGILLGAALADPIGTCACGRGALHCFERAAGRGGRVAEGTRLLSEYGAQPPSRVRIPPSPLTLHHPLRP